MIAVRQIITKHSVIIILIFIIGAYLVIKAVPENSWDGWGFGSAQTLLSARQWAKEGILKNYFLSIPQGYSKTVRYFDDQELRQHANGLATGGLIGKRLYYTHYPSGYVLPIALLMKLGVEQRFWFRFLEIFFSLVSLVILYWIFFMISNRFIAFLGVLYYGISILFLNYADSIVNQPLDELLRFAIILLSIIVLKNQKEYFNFLIWILYFILAFSSYDSTFFIFAWLVGLDLIVLRKIEWRKWLFWATAPTLAFALQILQNTLYLGWNDMLLDFFGAFKTEIVGSRKNFLISHLNRLTDPFDWFFGVKWYLGILISILGIATAKFIKKYSEDTLDIKFLYLGFFALLFNFLFFPSLFFFPARIVSVFGGLLIGILTVLTVKMLIKKNIKLNFKILFLIILTLTLNLCLIQMKRTYVYLKEWPNNIWLQEKIDFDKKIKNLTAGDKVIFQMLGTNREVAGSDRYPMAVSEDEYYIGSPILGFTNTNDLIRDFNYLKKRSEFPFNTIITVDQKPTIEKIKTKLKLKEPISKIDNKFILIIRQ